ncbi:hypothetical protein ACI780_10865 [Geodermatophilus sp. SYSU D00814]
MPDRVPRRLPLVDRFLAEFASGERPLAHHAALLVQHQMGTVVPMVAGLLTLGLRARDVWWVDVPYSANRTVQRHLAALGIPEPHFASPTHSLLEPYRPGQVRRVAAALVDADAVLPPGVPLLVLDDGAYVLQALAAGLVGVQRPLCIVEQTTRGVMHVREESSVAAVAATVPVVDVAESLPKRALEGPCIGRSVWESLHRRLRERSTLTDRSRVLVVGAGVVGRSVAQALVQVAGLRRDQVAIADPAPGPRAWAQAAGLPVWDRRSSDGGPSRHGLDVVVGCSGHPSFGPADVDEVEDGAVLASASSGDEEFSRQELLAAADSVTTRGSEPDAASVHDDLVLTFADRTVTLLNSGFPVNFDGRVNTVPPRYMQATRIAMIGAAVQAVSSGEPGLQPLDEAVVRWLMAHCPPTSHLLAPGGQG